MTYWLMKSEPSAYSRNDRLRDGPTHWDGERNYQVSNNIKIEKRIAGEMEVSRDYYPDHTDDRSRFSMADVKPCITVKSPVTLAGMKAEPKLSDLALVKQSRLPVLPVSVAHWKLFCQMAGGKT